MTESIQPIHLETAPTLRTYTPARVALTRTGISITTNHALDFALAHAQARDAVHSTLDTAALLAALHERELPAVSVHSAATTRTEYLRRPDLGRTLSAASTAHLATEPGAPSMQLHRESGPPPASLVGWMGGLSFAEANDNPSPAQPVTTLTIILADGLSAQATNRHAIPLLDALLPLLDEPFQLTPIVLAEQARVALGDPIGQALHAGLTVMLIGERPGLSSPDSLGVYITWEPRPGRTDAERNCVSNIRTQGLDYAAAATKIAWYLTEGRRQARTGTHLREPQSRNQLHSPDPPSNPQT